MRRLFSLCTLQCEAGSCATVAVKDLQEWKVGQCSVQERKLHISSMTHVEFVTILRQARVFQLPRVAKAKIPGL